MTEGNKPMVEVRDGAVKISGWLNESKEGRKFLSFSFQKTYKDKEGELKNTSSFAQIDLLKLKGLIDLAYQNGKMVLGTEYQKDKEGE